jgi:tetratricopeptide (TPR) repeat protein
MKEPLDIKKLLTETIRYMQEGETNNAKNKISQILKADPSHPDAQSLLGIITIHEGEIKKGIRLIEDSLLIKPNQPEACLHCGIAFYKENKLDQALDYFKQAIYFRPEYAEAYYCSALALQQKGFSDEAIEKYKVAIVKNSKYIDPRINLAYFYFELKKYDLAETEFLEILNLDPSNAEVIFMAAECENELGFYDKAIMNFEKSLKINPSQITAMNGLGYSYLQKKELDKSLYLFNRVMELEPQNILALNNRANIFYLKNEPNLCINDLDRLIKIDPTFPNAYNTYGNILSQIFDYARAREMYKKAIELDKNYFQAYQSLGVLCQEEKKIDEAISCFEKALAINPLFIESLNSLGTAFRSIKKYDLALEKYNKALEIDPNFASAYSNRGEIYDVMKFFDKGFEDHSKALQIEPDNTNANMNMGVHLLNLKKFENGWKHYEYRILTVPVHTTFFKYYSGLNAQKVKWPGTEHLGSILVVGEQGIGDQILYASMFQDLISTGNRITVSLDARLITLFKRSFSELFFIPTKDHLPQIQFDIKEFDYYILQGSIGNYFRKSLDDFKSQPISFLKANPKQKKIFEEKLLVPHKKLCGISWRSKNESFGLDKTINLDLLKPIFQIESFKFLNLQYGDVKQELNEFYEKNHILIEEINELDLYQDIDGLASLIDACNVIITSSNVTAHLAGSIGKATFLLVPYSVGKIWYWHEGDRTSIWYPKIRIFRQDADGSWINAINELIDALKGILNE